MVAAPLELLFDRRVSGWHYRETRAVLESCPPVLQDALAERYAAMSGDVRQHYAAGDGRCGDTWGDAAADLMRLGRELRRVKPQVAFDDDAIEAAADRAARFCMACATPAAVEYAERQGMTMPEGPNVTPKSIRRRLVSPDWWRRRLRTILTRACEELFRRLGFVRAQTSAYVSGDALMRVRLAAIKSRHWMSETVAVCEDTGECLGLERIAEHSLANPTLRRGELMLRARGFQETAGLHGHRCLMVTATCPSAFHPWLRTGAPNPLYNGSTPRDAQAWLNQHWARARAALKRSNVLYYGFRAAEPHHDATPHWHLVLYVPPWALRRVKRTIARAWLKDYADEPGARLHRVKFTDEDAAKGSGVGYLAKYVAKNIDGAGTIGGEVSDESGRPVSEDAQHAVAWARIHGIRQFQQLGGPAVTLWRELRRVREPCEWPPLEKLRLTTTKPQGAASDPRAQQKGQEDPLSAAYLTHSKNSPDASDECSQSGPSWARFITELGGIRTSLKMSRSFWDKQEPRTIDREGRKVMKLTRWGELPPFAIVGLKVIYRDRIRRLATHVHVWFLIFAPPGGALILGPVAITVLSAPSSGSPRAWTNPQETSQAPPA